MVRRLAGGDTTVPHLLGQTRFRNASVRLVRSARHQDWCHAQAWHLLPQLKSGGEIKMTKLVSLMLAAMLFCFTSGATFADDMRTVWVLSDQPQSLSLQFDGREIAHFDQTWTRTSSGYMTQIQFPVSELGRYQNLRLIRADGKGYSDWGAENISFLKHSNVGKGDPACVGGMGWCAIRGL